MKVHHLSCGSLCPLLFSTAKTPGAKRNEMVTHCLLIETGDCLVLVDTGFGLDDVRDGKNRLGRPFCAIARPRFDERDTAIRQIEAMGFDPRDVRHILPTHLDLDHSGGLPDFPEASVHGYVKEIDAAEARATLAEKNRYRPAHFAHGPKWVRHAPTGEKWFGFDCVRSIPGLPPEILIVPLVGHSRGHSGIAVKTSDGWLLHAGDAYFSNAEMHPTKPSCPAFLRAFQVAAAFDDIARRRNQERVRLVARDEKVNVFSAHDPYELERFTG